MECNSHNFLSYWAIFCPFTSLLTPKFKFGKNNKCLEILSFYTSASKMKIIRYMVPEI